MLDKLECTQKQYSSTAKQTADQHEKTISTEKGRSLVEMLATLAIIGVLSIGGIVGYSYA